jgi:hypothetical protein
MQIRAFALASIALASFAAFTGQEVSYADSAEKFAAAELPLTLTSFGAARLGDKVYVYGGHTGEAHSYSNDQQSNQLLSLDLSHPDQPWKVESESDRLQGLALIAYQGKVIRVGGFSALNAAGEKHVLKSTAEVAAYDVASGKWEELPALPEPRSSHDAILVGSKIYVVGGWQLDGGSSDSKWGDKAFVIDLAASNPQWSEIAAPPFKRRALSLAQLGDSIIAVGGMEANQEITRHTTIYSPAENAWHEGPELVGDGHMMGFGTAAIAVDGATLVSAIDGSLQELKVGADQWTPCGKTEDARFFHELISLDAHHVLVLGGANMGEHRKFQNIEVINLP